ncbi:MAG: phosphatase PAP2 family protein [Gordonia sp. (in: high G+C Gram-positive bacteria)]
MMRDDFGPSRWRWYLIGAVAVVLFVAVYVAGVWTYTGQGAENAALRGSTQVNLDETSAADQMLAGLALASIGVGVLLIGLVGLVRGGVRLAAAGLGVVALTGLSAEVLKEVLPRPALADAPVYLLTNSFPSGHTAMASGVACAALVVAPWRWRTPVMVVATAWAVAVSAYTVVARWHRLSDVVGAQMLALLATMVVALVLLRTGRVRRVVVPPSPMRSLIVGLGVAYVVVAGVFAVWAGRAGLRIVVGDESDFALYAAAQVAASVTTVATSLVVWWGWRGAEFGRRDRPGWMPVGR